MKTLVAALLTAVLGSPVAAQDKPNILVIWGDDIGTWNISHNNRGMMAYHTPSIDRIAKEGLSFTDYYAQQSCTAGRAAFIGGTIPLRTGMTKVGLPGAAEGWQEQDITIAAVLKEQGYHTGQFGKNHFGDRDEHLPTNHGFDEFLGPLYHLNASEEPENRDYPTDYVMPSGKTFFETYGPRGVIKSSMSASGMHKVEDTGQLTKKRMETIDDETVAAAKSFIKRMDASGEPWFCWWNGTRMHFRTYLKDEIEGISAPHGDEYHDGMMEHDMHVGQLLDLLDELGVADNTIVMYSTDNGPHFNTWPDAGYTPFRKEKNSNWEGAYRVPAFARWPGHWPAGITLNGLVAHEDWMVTFAAAAGKDDLKEDLLDGYRAISRNYRQHLDGYDMNEYFAKGDTYRTSSKNIQASPRKEFFYVNDDGQVVAIRLGDWKAVFLENRADAFEIWREPFTELRIPKLFNLRRDPFEKASIDANTYNDWCLDRPYVIVPMQQLAGRFFKTLNEYPPSQTPGSFNLLKIQEQIQNAASGK
ncbi:MAG: arylsulfatase [Planctomycetes bacterium]|nr:arylsulfatase [Planctomycetota bacterium]